MNRKERRAAQKKGGPMASPMAATLASAAREQGITAMTARDAEDALSWIARHADRAAPPIVLILGSLYLAGEILRKNGQPPG